MRRWALALLALALVICAGSCRRADDTTATPATSAAPAADQTAEWNQVQQYLKDNGATLESVLKEIQQSKALAEAQSKPSPLEKDLQVARLLLSAAQTAAQNRSPDDSAVALQRLERMLEGVMAELPATEMELNLERALYALKQETGADAITHASGALLAAVNVSVKATLPTLVPPVVKDIETAKAQVDKGDTQGAMKAIADLIGKVSEQSSVRSVSWALAGVRGAEEALQRRAWPVIVAELQQVDGLFAELVKASQPAPAAAEATSQEQGAAATPPAAEGAGEATSTSAPPEAAPATDQSTQPAAPPAPPAKQPAKKK